MSLRYENWKGRAHFDFEICKMSFISLLTITLLTRLQCFMVQWMNITHILYIYIYIHITGMKNNYLWSIRFNKCNLHTQNSFKSVWFTLSSVEKWRLHTMQLFKKCSKYDWSHTVIYNMPLAKINVKNQYITILVLILSIIIIN